jgi:hypothetical protein
VRGDPREVAAGVVAERFPDAVAAFLGGTVLGSLRTPLSDLDIVVLLPEGTAEGRETTEAGGWTVELFAMTRSAYGRIVARDVAARR